MNTGVTGAAGWLEVLYCKLAVRSALVLPVATRTKRANALNTNGVAKAQKPQGQVHGPGVSDTAIAPKNIWEVAKAFQNINNDESRILVKNMA